LQYLQKQGKGNHECLSSETRVFIFLTVLDLVFLICRQLLRKRQSLSNKPVGA